MIRKLNLYTHDGLFHADDVFATALLSLMCEEINVVRGSDTEIPSGSDWIVFDIGEGELDHHSPENKETNGFHPDTNVPYASCGLVWKKYYEQILECMDCPERYYDQVYRKLENSLILGIDAVDNGVSVINDALEKVSYLPEEQKNEIQKQARVGFTVTDIVRDYNPTWNSSLDAYDCFLDAVAFAKDILVNRIDSIISAMDARDYVLQCIDFSGNHIMLMDQFAPWEGTLYARSKYDQKAMDVWYVVYPALRGGWNVQCALNNSDDRTSYRHPLPASWYGLRYEELKEASGIDTASFCHVSGFLAGCDDQMGALEMAQKARDE